MCRATGLLVVVIVVIVVVVVLFVPIGPVYLTPGFAPWVGRDRSGGPRNGYRVDIRVGGIGSESVFQRVEVAGHNILPQDRLDVILGPRPGNCSAILRATLRSWPGESRRQC